MFSFVFTFLSLYVVIRLSVPSLLTSLPLSHSLLHQSNMADPPNLAYLSAENLSHILLTARTLRASTQGLPQETIEALIQNTISYDISQCMNPHTLEFSEAIKLLRQTVLGPPGPSHSG